MSGAFQILQYNRHYYLTGLAAFIAFGILLTFDSIPLLGRIAVLAAMSILAFWWIGSLLASYYVYDYAGVTRWNWIPEVLSATPRRWLNVHSGLDESSKTLARLFPHAEGATLDIYDPAAMTEPSIARARRRTPSEPGTVSCRWNALPIADRSLDTLFMLLAAHEIRDPRGRVELFHEVARVLAESGQVLLTEHVRDWRNFLAFGPGFLHFHTRNEWIRVAREAGFSLEREGFTTPLVRWFLLRKGIGI